VAVAIVVVVVVIPLIPITSRTPPSPIIASSLLGLGGLPSLISIQADVIRETTAEGGGATALAPAVAADGDDMPPPSLLLLVSTIMAQQRDAFNATKEKDTTQQERGCRSFFLDLKCSRHKPPPKLFLRAYLYPAWQNQMRNINMVNQQKECVVYVQWRILQMKIRIMVRKKREGENEDENDYFSFDNS